MFAWLLSRLGQLDNYRITIDDHNRRLGNNRKWATLLVVTRDGRIMRSSSKVPESKAILRTAVLSTEYYPVDKLFTTPRKGEQTLWIRQWVRFETFNLNWCRSDSAVANWFDFGFFGAKHAACWNILTCACNFWWNFARRILQLSSFARQLFGGLTCGPTVSVHRWTTLEKLDSRKFKTLQCSFKFRVSKRSRV